MKSGLGKILSMESLYDLDKQLDSKWLLQNIEKTWVRRKTGKHSLLFCVLESLRNALMRGVFPRLCLIGFKFAQPFLINRIILFVESGGREDSKNIGYGLIGATGLIYVGLAVSI